MYLQTGDERQWLRQQRQSIEAQAVRHPTPATTPISAELAGASGGAARMVADRVAALLRSIPPRLGTRTA